MATRTITLSTGACIGVGVPRVRSITLAVGPGIGVGAVPWGGSVSALKHVPWIPKAGTPLLQTDANGQMRNALNPVWDRALRWLFDQYIGGLTAPTIAQINTAVVQTQAQAVSTASYAEQVAGYVQGVAATATATAEVAQNNGLTGAESIPPSPEPPPRPRAGSQAV